MKQFAALTTLLCLIIIGCSSTDADVTNRDLLAIVVSGEEVELPDATRLQVDLEDNYIWTDPGGNVLDSGHCRHRGIGRGEPTYEQSASKLIDLHAALRNDDAEATAELFRYPIRVQGTDGPAVHVLDKQHFVDRFDVLFPPQSVDTILATSPLVPECSRYGFTSGGGIVWSWSAFHLDPSFDHIYLAPQIRSTDINGPSPAEQHITDAALQGTHTGDVESGCHPPMATSYRGVVQAGLALQEAAASSDPNDLLAHVRFPLRAHNSDRPTDHYETAAGLLANFDNVFTALTIEHLLVMNPAEAPICTYEGFGLDRGLVWLWSDEGVMTIQTDPTGEGRCSTYQSFCRRFDERRGLIS